MKKLIKTDDWLSVKDLHGVFVGGLQEIYSNLQKYASVYPDVISYRLMPGYKKRQVLCLKKSFVSEFAKITGLELRDNENFLSARKVKKHVFGNLEKISSALSQYAQRYPERVKVKRLGIKKLQILLNKNYLDDFISVSGLVSYNDKDLLKTDDWLSVKEIEKFVVGNHNDFLHLLREKQSLMPYAIQYKKTGSNIILCLNKKYIDDLANANGLVLRKNLPESKTTDWLTNVELKEFIANGEKQIRRKLKELKSVMPYAIQIKVHKAKLGLCLNKKYLDEFLQKSGFKRAGQEITSLKTIAWLSADEIKKYVVATQSQIQELLVAYKKIKGAGVVAYKKEEGKKQPILCLNKKYLKNFVNTYDLKWKRDVLRAGMIKLQTINPNKQFDTIFIHAKKTNESSK